MLPQPLSGALSRVEPYGFFIILGVLFILPLLGNTLDMDLSITDWLVFAPAEWLQLQIARLVGP